MKSYKETKENYDKGADWHIQKSLSYNWKSQINRFVRGLNGRRVLDVGCGGGRDIAEFLKRGLQVDGIDYSGQTIRRCREKFSEANFYEGDTRKMPLPDKKYGGLWVCASLLNIEKSEVPIALSEFKRVLKKNGVLFISVKEGKGERMVADKAGERFFSFYSVSELKALVQKAGFKVTRVEVISDARLTGKIGSKQNPDWICLFAKNLSTRFISKNFILNIN